MLHFESYEFDSPDQIGSGEKMDASFLQMLDDARGIAGVQTPHTLWVKLLTSQFLQALKDI